jgi:hypothetical protein
MTNTKHTPGPWTVVKGNNGFCDTWQVEYKTQLKHGTIADCGFITAIYADGTRKEKLEHLANARLIAAAPDMLLALENMVNNKLSASACRLVARAAIQKAKGE